MIKLCQEQVASVIHVTNGVINLVLEGITAEVISQMHIMINTFYRILVKPKITRPCINYPKNYECALGRIKHNLKLFTELDTK